MRSFAISVLVAGAALLVAKPFGPIYAQSGGSDPHAYFKALVARPDHWVSYSLRDQAQLTKYRHSDKTAMYVTYDPANDSYPMRQDAAKIVIPAGSLPNQVHLPLNLQGGGTALMTWDAWWGPEFLTKTGGLNNHKTFQISSPWSRSELFFEIRSLYGNSGSGDIAEVDVRSYAGIGPNAWKGGLDRLEPRKAAFMIKPATWTRYYVFYEAVPNAHDRFSIWIADENRNPVQIYDRVQVDAVNEQLTKLRIEFNTSQQRDPALGPLVAYVRNMVVLKGLTDPTALFQRPGAGGTLPPYVPPAATAPAPPANLRFVP